MAVFLTGDTHGELDIAKVERFAQNSEGLTRDDALIILGDFGLVWVDPPTQKETDRLDWLESQPWTTFVVDGNHENFDMLERLPVVPGYGGMVQEIRPHVIHLMRGETYVIGGHSFFVVGGAHSIDAQLRVPHRSWWSQEVPNEQERERIAAAAQSIDEVDYVLSHCPPTGCYQWYRLRFPKFWGPSDEYTDWLEEHVEGQFAYKRWFYGHLHMDLPLDEPHTVLYNEVFDLDGTERTVYGTNMGICPQADRHEWVQCYEPPEKGEKHSHAWYQCVHCGRTIELW